MKVSVVINRGSLAGSAARDAEAAKKNAPPREASGMGFTLRAEGGRIVRNQPAGPEAVATVALPPVQQALYPDTPRSGTVTSIGARLKQALRSFFV